MRQQDRARSHVGPDTSAKALASIRRKRIPVASSAAIAIALWTTPAQAQAHASEGEPQIQSSGQPSSEIIVTARKRQESILKVPVVVTAISNEALTDTQVTQVTDLPRLVPGLVIGGSLLSIGPQVSIRGVGTSALDPGVEQSVSLNIDGLSLGHGLAFGSAMFDVAQVEVLKGPQALFYGKSSPGGVISIRTADPTDQYEVIASAGYEFYAREIRGELIGSGPLTDTLGLRVAGMFSDADGYFKSRGVAIPETGAANPNFDREPQPENYALRGTLLWRPDDRFSARLKVNHVHDRQVNAELKQLAACPGGNDKAFGFGSGLPGSPIPAAPNFLTPIDPIPFMGGDDCKFNRTSQLVYLDPDFFPGVPNGGVPYLENTQSFGTLQLDYDLTPELALTSTTAYYKLNSSSSANPTYTTAAAPTFGVTNRFRRREFTQELRLDSDFSGPLNFTLGAFFQDGRLYDRVRFIRNTAYGFISPAVVGADILNDHRESTIDIKTYSIFGQARYKITPQLELAGGVRWSDEARRLSVYDLQNAVDLTPFLPTPSIGSKTWSPEATITYTPTDDLTLFASYKKGYKSGSFSVSVPAAAIFDPDTGEIIGATDKSFGDENVQGYEFGLKSRLLDRRLLVNIAFYDYTYKGLQVGTNEPAPGGVPELRTVNAGKARTYGVDFDASYRPVWAENLALNASVNWNKSRYVELDTVPCFQNQTISQGCVFVPDPFRLDAETGQPRYTAQNLSGLPMIRAPKWAINFGFDYELPVGSDMTVKFTNNNQYSSKYLNLLGTGLDKGFNYQDSFFRTDAAIALKGAENRWEVALIGRNLTNRLVASNCSLANVAGGLVLPSGGDNYGGASPGAAGLPETLCYPDGPGRSVWVRLTFRPFG